MSNVNTNKVTNGGEQADQKAKNRRRTYIINPGFQWKYATMIGLVVFLFTCVISCVLYGLLHHQARMRLINPGHYAADVAPVIIFFSIVFAAITAGGVGIWSAFASQKICGPLYVLERYLIELAQGKFPNCRPLRRKDEFKELYAAFTRAVDSLREQRQQEFAMLTRDCNVARAAVNGDEESRKHALRSVTEDLEKLRCAIGSAIGERVEPGMKTPSLRVPEDKTSPAGIA